MTQEDVDRLLVDASPDSRTAVLSRITEHYNGNAFNPREREIAEQIFRFLMHDAIVTVREMLAARIQHNASIPRDIVLQLAEDVESVALPVLAHSEVFSDADLVAIVESSSEVSRLLAISRRTHVSPQVCDALVDRSDPQVISSLLTNDGAEISRQAFTRIVDDFHDVPVVMQSLVKRNALPMVIVERLMHEASAVVVTQLREKYPLSDAQLRQEGTQVREDVLVYLLSHDISEAEMQALVAQMHVDNRLTPSLLMTALCRGQLPFFIVAMAHRAGVPIDNAKQLVADKGDLGFLRLYEKARLPESMKAAAQLVLRAAQKLQRGEAVPGSLIYANQLAEQVLNDVGEDNIHYLPHFMALIRQTVQRH